MSGRIPDWTLTHTVVIEPYLGTNATGAVYGPPVAWPCLRVDKRRRRREQDQREITTDVHLYLAPEAAGQVPPESRATVDGERTGTVSEVDEHVHPGLPTPDHVHLLLE